MMIVFGGTTQLILPHTAVDVPSDDDSGRRTSPPVHFAVHPETSKLVVAAGNRLGARSPESGTILLGTILQTPVSNPQDEVCLEVPMEQVRFPFLCL